MCHVAGTRASVFLYHIAYCIKFLWYLGLSCICVHSLLKCLCFMCCTCSCSVLWRPSELPLLLAVSSPISCSLSIVHYCHKARILSARLLIICTRLWRQESLVSTLRLCQYTFYEAFFIKHIPCMYFMLL